MGLVMNSAFKRAIGLMSGTSADGVDAALIETDGVTIRALGPRHFVGYAPEERRQILELMQKVKATDGAPAREALGAEIVPLVTGRHERAIRELMEMAGLGAGEVDVIGFHGQTLFHDPAAGYTLQVGDAAALARKIGVPVVHQMRRADMAAGGEGAPLVPVYHAALVAMADLALPVAVVNIGGVANITYIANAGDDGPNLTAFDVGPGNVLIDEWVGLKAGARFDDGGALASAGRVDEAALAAMLAHDYFRQPPPKSLDRYDFDFAAVEGLSLEDGAATLTALTAKAIAGARGLLPLAPRAWVIVGGGVHNAAMMEALQDELDVPVHSGAALGWSPGYVEAEAFGFLAVRHLAGLPLTFPGTTGVKAPTPGGELALPEGL